MLKFVALVLFAFSSASFASTRPAPPPPPPPHYYNVYAAVGTTYFGMGQIDVDQYVYLASFQGYRLRKVVLHASSPHFPPVRGEVTFCVAQGCAPKVQVNPGSREQVFYPKNQYVDPYNARAWHFETKGGVYVDSFTLQFAY